MKKILYSLMILSLVFAVSCKKDEVAVTGVELNHSSYNLNMSGTLTLVATVLPTNADNKKVTWSSSNTDVATVTNGIVTPVSLGTSTITVTTVDGGKTATCDVTVVNDPSLQLGVKGEHIQNNSELYYFGTPWSSFNDDLKLYLLLTNKTNNAIMVQGNYSAVEEPSGTISYWCVFENCWPTPVLPPRSMPANFTEGLDDMFYLNVGLNDNFEVATYTVNFNVVGNSTDKVSVKMHFVHREHIPEGLPFDEELLAEIESSEEDVIVFVKGGLITSKKRLQK
jgi:hypothetical protein